MEMIIWLNNTSYEHNLYKSIKKDIVCCHPTFTKGNTCTCVLQIFLDLLHFDNTQQNIYNYIIREEDLFMLSMTVSLYDIRYNQQDNYKHRSYKCYWTLRTIHISSQNIFGIMNLTGNPDLTIISFNLFNLSKVISCII